MTPDDIARKVAERLPCNCDKRYFPTHVHYPDCRSYEWPAVEALVREAYEAGIDKTIQTALGHVYHMHHNNEYPVEAIPKANLLMLKKLCEAKP